MQLIRLIKPLDKDTKEKKAKTVFFGYINPQAIKAIEKIPNAPADHQDGCRLALGPYHYYDIQETFEQVEAILRNIDQTDNCVFHLFPPG